MEREACRTSSQVQWKTEDQGWWPGKREKGSTAARSQKDAMPSKGHRLKAENG